MRLINNSLKLWSLNKSCLISHTSVTKICVRYRFTERSHRSFIPVQRELRRRQLRLGPQKPQHRNTFIEWNYDAELYSFQKRLKEEFDDNLLRRALIDSSYISQQAEEQAKIGMEPGLSKEDNSLFVTKGEDIIRLFCQQYLRHVLPRFPEEGILSLWNHLLSDEVLSNVSFHIGTSELVFCLEFPPENVTLARVLKALVYALGESSGLDKATIFVRDFILTQLAERNINDLWPIENPIEVLNNICHNEGLKEKPEPRIIGEAGVNTLLATYRVGLYIDKQMIGLGNGESLDVAYEMAATDTLRRLFHTSENKLLIPFDLSLKPKLEEGIPNVSIKDWSEESIKKQQQLRNA